MKSKIKDSGIWITLFTCAACLGLPVALSLPQTGTAQPATDNAKEVNSRSSRVKADLRSMATAIESYFIDHNVYPAFTQDPELVVDMSARKACPNLDWSPPTFRRSVSTAGGRDIFSLSTPIAYITSHFPDAFGPREKQCSRTYAFYSIDDKEREGWISWSAGPDGDYDLDWTQYKGMKKKGGDPTYYTEFQSIIIDSIYDPTNGVVSNGDILRMKQ